MGEINSKSQKENLKQHFNEDSKGNIEVINSLDLDTVLKDNYQEKIDTYKYKGMTSKGTMRKVCSIPTYMFAQEPLLKEYMTNLKHNQPYARRCLKTWLSMNPLFKTNEGSL